MLLLLVLPFVTKWSTLIVFIHVVKLTLGRVHKLLGVCAWKRFTSGFSREEPVVSRFAETTAHSQRRGRSLGRAWYSWGDTHHAVTPTETRPSLFINVGRRGCAAGSFRHYYESARKPTILLFLSTALSNSRASMHTAAEWRLIGSPPGIRRLLIFSRLSLLHFVWGKQKRWKFL